MAITQKIKRKHKFGSGVKVIKGVILFSLTTTLTYAETNKMHFNNLKQNVSTIFAPKSNQNFSSVNINELSNFKVDTSAIPELPIISLSHIDKAEGKKANVKIGFNDAVRRAVQRNPDIAQNIALLASQNANIDVAKSGYYPQLSGGLSTGDFTTGERGRQLISLSASQLVYDFGKVKSEVSVEEAQLLARKANILVSIENVAFSTANAIVNIKRYQESSQIADQQVKGIAAITEIANLRANAGISSQADPVQAQSYLESARANLIVQQTQLRQYQQRLRTLVGFDTSNLQWNLPENLILESNLYKEPEFNQVPKMILAQAEIDVAQKQLEQMRISNYPSLHLKGSVSQAVNGRNPNNNEDDGLYSSIMLEASSNFYQGGATGSRIRAANYAEQAARARMNSTYLEVLEQVRVLREEIENKQRKMGVLMARKETAIRTKELYQEQYKLGTRTVVDLLNAEQSIHSAALEIESARYDILTAIVNYVAQTGRSRDIYDLNNISIQGFEIQ